MYYLVLIVNPMGRILVRWKSLNNNLEIQCKPIGNWLYGERESARAPRARARAICEYMSKSLSWMSLAPRSRFTRIHVYTERGRERERDGGEKGARVRARERASECCAIVCKYVFYILTRSHIVCVCDPYVHMRTVCVISLVNMYVLYYILLQNILQNVIFMEQICTFYCDILGGYVHSILHFVTECLTEFNIYGTNMYILLWYLGWICTFYITFCYRMCYRM